MAFVQMSEKLRRGLKEARKQAKRALDMTIAVRELAIYGRNHFMYTFM